MKNALICAVRSAWYSTYESWRLRYERRKKVLGLWSLQTRDPLVSILIPTHNRCELLLTRALPSVLQQTYHNIEILVCAHGCTDDTVERVQERRWFGTGGRLKLINVPRRRTYPPTAENHWFAGPVDPINAGLKAARGKWIARIDDDDEWDRDHVERLLRFAQHGNHEFVSSEYAVQQPDGSYKAVGSESDKNIGGVQTWLYRSYLRFMRANPDCWRKKWNRVNDTDLAERFVKAGVRIGYLPIATAAIKPRPGETTVGLKAYQQNRAETERALAFK